MLSSSFQHQLAFKTPGYRLMTSHLESRLLAACPSSYERHISRTPPGNFFKFRTDVQLDSRTNGLDFGGPRSKVKVCTGGGSVSLCSFGRPISRSHVSIGQTAVTLLLLNLSLEGAAPPTWPTPGRPPWTTLWL